MAKTKNEARKPQAKAKDSVGPNGQVQESAEELFAQAVQLAEQSQPGEALVIAEKLLSIVQSRSVGETLPALDLLGEISLELGEAEQARAYFEKAVQLDPKGELQGALGDGAEKFLWLAQLCEDGGRDSVNWFERAAEVLQRDIATLESGENLGLDPEALLVLRAEKKAKLANALCGIVEVYMTDLSWDDDAEEKCENLITHAMSVEDETSPEVLQTLASVRLSQDRKDDAQAALTRSYESWKDLDEDDDAIPDFPVRISLARLLMEAEMEDDAMDVVERLVLEDDQSVEAWYLGGWCQWLLAESAKALAEHAEIEAPAEVGSFLRGSRRWLKTSLKLFEQLDYEDDRLRDHAAELVTDLDATLGPEDDEAESEDEWEGIEDDDEPEDEEMEDA